jgi:hypothetical protein
MSRVLSLLPLKPKRSRECQRPNLAPPRSRMPKLNPERPTRRRRRLTTAYIALVNLVKPREGAEAGSRHVVLGGKRGNRANPS